MGRKLKHHDHKASIYFQIFDESLWQMIDKLMTLPHYANSRTSLLNNALAYGLPKLIDAEFGEVKLEEEPPSQREMDVARIERAIDVRTDLLARLLQEVIMNTTISKSLVCSLFNAKNAELNDKPLSGKRFDEGGLRYTPNCMEQYEINRLNGMDDDDDDDD